MIAQPQTGRDDLPPNPSPPLWQQVTIFSFGVLFVSILLGLAFLVPCPTRPEYVTAKIVLSLAAAAVATLLTGFIDIEIPNFLKAGGALAVFAIVYFYSPAGAVLGKDCNIVDPMINITRLADFRKSGCRPDGAKRDIVIIDDEYRFLPGSFAPRSYHATARVQRGQSVQFYDMNISPSTDVPPPQHYKDDRDIVLHWNVEIKGGLGRARYIWRNANQTDHEGIYFKTLYRIHDLTASYLLPPGKSVRITGFNPPEIWTKCRNDPVVDRVTCKDLDTHEPVTIKWDWDMWSLCGGKERPG